MANLNVNKTTSNGSGNQLTSGMQTYYDRKMIMDMKPKLVHYEYGQKRPLPANEGKLVQFRKWTPFAAQTAALAEGVVPDGQALNLSAVTEVVKAYGGYVAISDLLDMTALDPVINDSVELMADQGALTIDTLTREAVQKGSNVIYAASGGTPAEGRSALTSAHKLTSTELRKAVRLLKKNKAPQFMRAGKGYYVCVVGPDSVFDLQSDTTWVDVSKYQESEQIFSGEIGRLFGVIVVETPEAHFFHADSHILKASMAANVNDVATFTTIATNAYNAATPSIQITQTLSALGSSGGMYVVGREIVIAGQKRKVMASSEISTSPTGMKLTLDAPLTGYATGASDLNGITVYPAGGDSTGGDVASTLVFGKDAYGVIDLEGHNVQAIVKDRGSAGSADPLDQISTVGWKVDGFAAKILQDAWLVRIEHGFSA